MRPFAQNDSARSTASQVKTPAPKSTAQNVTIVVTKEETGKLAAKFEVPKFFHDAMLRSAKAKGISPQEWVEEAVRKQMDKPLTETDAPAHQEGDIDLMLVSAKQGTDVGYVNLSDEEFAKLQRSAATQNISLTQLLAHGFEQMANPGPAPQQRTS